MPADETNSSNAVPVEPTHGVADAADGTPNRAGLHRRTFLKAAALGAAAAALINRDGGRLHLGPSLALADDHSTDPCTAGDIEVAETGTILNEPCSCTPGATFDAIVAFDVTNKTGTGRYCISLHLVAAGGVAAQDVILRTGTNGVSGSSTVPANTTQTMYGVIKGIPCSAGKICFTQGTPDNRGKCAPSTCVTVSFVTTPNGADCTLDANGNSPNFPNGQCRHQQICIVGFGATLTCTAGCTPACGGTATLKATVEGGKSPYFFTLTGTDGTSQRYPTTGTTTDTSHDFTVTVTKNTTYTLTVTDANGCTRTATTSLTASAISVDLVVSGGSNCNGVLTFTANVTGGTGCSYKFTVDGGSGTASSSNQFTYGPTLDGTCHTVRVEVDCGGCTASAEKKISQCVTTTSC